MLLAICLSTAYSSIFKIAVLPDTQGYVNDPSRAGIFTQQTQWIVNNKTSQSIAFVTHLGDIVSNGNEFPVQWTYANTAMSILDGQLPYSVCIGNHDYDVVADKNDPFGNGATAYKTYFGSSRYAPYSSTWYKGCSPRGLSHYQIFTAGGKQWLHLNLEWEPDLSVLMWAQKTIDDHNILPVIISTHAFMNMHNPSDPNSTGLRGQTTGPAANGGYEMWHKFVSHNDQIFMVLNGHYDNEDHITLQNDYGKNVCLMTMDYQGRDNGGDGWMNLIEFDDTNSIINVKTYSPKLDQWETDANSAFSFNVNFNTRFTNFGRREIIFGIPAANINVGLTTETTADISIPSGQSTSDFYLDLASSNKGDYACRIGSILKDDQMSGVLISSVAENGRSQDNGYRFYHTSTGSIGSRGYLWASVSPTAVLVDYDGAPYQLEGGGESDVNVAAAYFPFSRFIGAHCQELASNKIFSAAGNGIVFGDNLTQYPNSNDDPELIVQKVAGDPWGQGDSDRGIFELTLPGVNSLTDGIILANTNDNTDNFVTVSPHTDGNGWQISTIDNGGEAWTECSGFSFVYLPYSTPGIVAGRFKQNTAEIVAGTGGFKVESVATGVARLRIAGCVPGDGALLITGENQWYNFNDCHTYAADDVNGCWIIQSHGLPTAALAGTATEHYVFAFIPFDGYASPLAGSGTPEDPYQIYTKQELEMVDWWPSAHFKLMNNINLSDTTYNNSLIAPDGAGSNDSFSGTAFSGTFDGQGYTIQNLTIQAGHNDHVGLFGQTTSETEIKNLTLQNVSVTSDSNMIGSLVGSNSGDISNCHVIGTVIGGAYRVGGLVGYTYSNTHILNCDTAVTVTGGQRVGGLVGDAYQAIIQNCHTTGNVTVATGDSVGGFIGQNNATDIDNCYAVGKVTTTGNVKYVGGFAGNNYRGDIDNCHASGDVNSTYNSIGGFVGRNQEGHVEDSYATGTVKATTSGGNQVGGFVGYNYGKNDYDENFSATITRCYATGNVTATYYVGGFCGRGIYPSSITSSYAIGNVTGTGTASGGETEAGGFIGRMSTTSNTQDCYATGSVSAIKYAGGFIGGRWGNTLANCYSTGHATATTGAGGFNGTGTAAVTSCYWDKDASANPTSGLAVGKTTAEMKTLTTFTGWSFPAGWKIHNLVSYPKLSWQNFAVSDLDFDGDIDFIDLKALADNWLATGIGLVGDIHVDSDNRVNFLDFADFAEDWCN